MTDLIKINNKDGKQLVSARDLYLGLGLSEAVWSRWYVANIVKNEFFQEGVDWIGIQHNVENPNGGRPTQDFAITLEFAKHIAMMARTEKSHEYRNYFIECEKKLKEPVKELSAMELLKLQYRAIEEQDEKINKVAEKVNTLEDNMPLFNIDCEELQAQVKKIGIAVLGGKNSPAYNDNSTRQKVYVDIQNQLKREFGVQRYKAIKRCQLKKALETVSSYKVPMVLEEDIKTLNNQISF